MFIYKYSPEPWFFEEGLIRFTQPSGLNDPDDARPDFLYGKYSPEDYADARRRAEQAGLTSATNELLETFFLRPFPARRIDEKGFPGLWPFTETRLRKDPF
jgi:hypothetical protein